MQNHFLPGLGLRFFVRSASEPRSLAGSRNWLLPAITNIIAALVFIAAQGGKPLCVAEHQSGCVGQSSIYS